MDTDGCPQADGDEWSEISGNGQELKEKYISTDDTDGHGWMSASGRG